MAHAAMLHDPVTGQPLGRAPIAERPACRDAAGRRRPVSRTVAGFDLTFSAPKSLTPRLIVGRRTPRGQLGLQEVRPSEPVSVHDEDVRSSPREQAFGGGDGLVGECPPTGGPVSAGTPASLACDR